MNTFFELIILSLPNFKESFYNAIDVSKYLLFGVGPCVLHIMYHIMMSNEYISIRMAEIFTEYLSDLYNVHDKT